MNTTTSSFPRGRPSHRPAPAGPAPKAGSPDATPDAELVRRFVAGDEGAFLEIMNRNRGRIFATVRHFLPDLGDAEEITQDTFIRAHRGLRDFRGDCAIYTWLRHIALNLARNRYWYNHRRRYHATLSLDSPLQEDSTATLGDLIATRELDPVRAAAMDEFSQLVQACMQNLPPPQREILTLHSVLHRSYEDITRLLGISGGTVKSRISRARENLRKLLEMQCPEFRARTDCSPWFEAARDTGSPILAVA